MITKLRYGRDILEIEVPDTADIIESPAVAIVANPDKAVREALNKPIGSSSLKSILARHNNPSVCVVTSDYTRPLPYRAVLPALLGYLGENGISGENITLLIATGMHRASTDDEKREMFGDIVDNYRIIDHDARDNASMKLLAGNTSRGTRVSIDRIFMEADIKIAVGLIEPHFMAGYSGGRKSICPGLVDLKSVTNFHSPEFLEDPLSDNCLLAGNPCHEESLEIAKMSGVDFIINVTINHRRELTGIFAGDLEQAHNAGVKLLDSYVKVKIKELYDVVVTSGGGYPLDATLYQSAKGMVAAMPAVKAGGTIIMASACSEGLGSDQFVQLLLKYNGRPEQFVPDMKKHSEIVRDQWGVQMQFKPFRKVNMEGLIFCTSGIGPELLPKCSVTSGYNFSSDNNVRSMVEGAIEHALKKCKGARVAVVPEGPYVIPVKE